MAYVPITKQQEAVRDLLTEEEIKTLPAQGLFIDTEFWTLWTKTTLGVMVPLGGGRSIDISSYPGLGEKLLTLLPLQQHTKDGNPLTVVEVFNHLYARATSKITPILNPRIILNDAVADVEAKEITLTFELLDFLSVQFIRVNLRTGDDAAPDMLKLVDVIAEPIADYPVAQTYTLTVPFDEYSDDRDAVIITAGQNELDYYESNMLGVNISEPIIEDGTLQLTEIAFSEDLSTLSATLHAFNVSPDTPLVMTLTTPIGYGERELVDETYVFTDGQHVVDFKFNYAAAGLYSVYVEGYDLNGVRIKSQRRPITLVIDKARFSEIEFDVDTQTYSFKFAGDDLIPYKYTTMDVEQHNGLATALPANPDAGRAVYASVRLAPSNPDWVSWRVDSGEISQRYTVLRNDAQPILPTFELENPLSTTVLATAPYLVVDYLIAGVIRDVVLYVSDTENGEYVPLNASYRNVDLGATKFTCYVDMAPIREDKWVKAVIVTDDSIIEGLPVLTHLDSYNVTMYGPYVRDNVITYGMSNSHHLPSEFTRQFYIRPFSESSESEWIAVDGINVTDEQLALVGDKAELRLDLSISDTVYPAGKAVFLTDPDAITALQLDITHYEQDVTTGDHFFYGTGIGLQRPSEARVDDNPSIMTWDGDQFTVRFFVESNEHPNREPFNLPLQAPVISGQQEWIVNQWEGIYEGAISISVTSVDFDLTVGTVRFDLYGYGYTTNDAQLTYTDSLGVIRHLRHRGGTTFVSPETNEEHEFTLTVHRLSGEPVYITRTAFCPAPAVANSTDIEVLDIRENTYDLDLVVEMGFKVDGIDKRWIHSTYFYIDDVEDNVLPGTTSYKEDDEFLTYATINFGERPSGLWHLDIRAVEKGGLVHKRVISFQSPLPWISFVNINPDLTGQAIYVPRVREASNPENYPFPTGLWTFKIGSSTKVHTVEVLAPAAYTDDVELRGIDLGGYQPTKLSEPVEYDHVSIDAVLETDDVAIGPRIISVAQQGRSVELQWRYRSNFSSSVTETLTAKAAIDQSGEAPIIVDITGLVNDDVLSSGTLTIPDGVEGVIGIRVLIKSTDSAGQVDFSSSPVRLLLRDGPFMVVTSHDASGVTSKILNLEAKDVVTQGEFAPRITTGIVDIDAPVIDLDNELIAFEGTTAKLDYPSAFGRNPAFYKIDYEIKGTGERKHLNGQFVDPDQGSNPQLFDAIVDVVMDTTSLEGVTVKGIDLASRSESLYILLSRDYPSTNWIRGEFSTTVVHNADMAYGVNVTFTRNEPLTSLDDIVTRQYQLVGVSIDDADLWTDGVIIEPQYRRTASVGYDASDAPFMRIGDYEHYLLSPEQEPEWICSVDLSTRGINPNAIVQAIDSEGRLYDLTHEGTGNPTPEGIVTTEFRIGNYPAPEDTSGFPYGPYGDHGVTSQNPIATLRGGDVITVRVVDDLGTYHTQTWPAGTPDIEFPDTREIRVRNVSYLVSDDEQTLYVSLKADLPFLDANTLTVSVDEGDYRSIVTAPVKDIGDTWDFLIEVPNNDVVKMEFRIVDGLGVTFDTTYDFSGDESQVGVWGDAVVITELTVTHDQNVFGGANRVTITFKADAEFSLRPDEVEIKVDNVLHTAEYYRGTSPSGVPLSLTLNLALTGQDHTYSEIEISAKSKDGTQRAVIDYTRTGDEVLTGVPIMHAGEGLRFISNPNGQDTFKLTLNVDGIYKSGVSAYINEAGYSVDSAYDSRYITNADGSTTFIRSGQFDATEATTVSLVYSVDGVQNHMTTVSVDGDTPIVTIPLNALGGSTTQVNEPDIIEIPSEDRTEIRYEVKVSTPITNAGTTVYIDGVESTILNEIVDPDPDATGRRWFEMVIDSPTANPDSLVFISKDANGNDLFNNYLFLGGEDHSGRLSSFVISDITIYRDANAVSGKVIGKYDLENVIESATQIAHNGSKVYVDPLKVERTGAITVEFEYLVDDVTSLVTLEILSNASGQGSANPEEFGVYEFTGDEVVIDLSPVEFNPTLVSRVNYMSGKVEVVIDFDVTSFNANTLRVTDKDTGLAIDKTYAVVDGDQAVTLTLDVTEVTNIHMELVDPIGIPRFMDYALTGSEPAMFINDVIPLTPAFEISAPVYTVGTDTAYLLTVQLSAVFPDVESMSFTSDTVTTPMILADLPTEVSEGVWEVVIPTESNALTKLSLTQSNVKGSMSSAYYFGNDAVVPLAVGEYLVAETNSFNLPSIRIVEEGGLHLRIESDNPAIMWDFATIAYGTGKVADVAEVRSGLGGMYVITHPLDGYVRGEDIILTVTSTNDASEVRNVIEVLGLRDVRQLYPEVIVSYPNSLGDFGVIGVSYITHEGNPAIEVEISRAPEYSSAEVVVDRGNTRTIQGSFTRTDAGTDVGIFLTDNLNIETLEVFFIVDGNSETATWYRDGKPLLIYPVGSLPYLSTGGEGMVKLEHRYSNEVSSFVLTTELGDVDTDTLTYQYDEEAPEVISSVFTIDGYRMMIMPITYYVPGASIVIAYKSSEGVDGSYVITPDLPANEGFVAAQRPANVQPSTEEAGTSTGNFTLSDVTFTYYDGAYLLKMNMTDANYAGEELLLELPNEFSGSSPNEEPVSTGLGTYALEFMVYDTEMDSFDITYTSESGTILKANFALDKVIFPVGSSGEFLISDIVYVNDLSPRVTMIITAPDYPPTLDTFTFMSQGMLSPASSIEDATELGDGKYGLVFAVSDVTERDFTISYDDLDYNTYRASYVVPESLGELSNSFGALTISDVSLNVQEEGSELVFKVDKTTNGDSTFFFASSDNPEGGMVTPTITPYMDGSYGIAIPATALFDWFVFTDSAGPTNLTGLYVSEARGPLPYGIGDAIYEATGLNIVYVGADYNGENILRVVSTEGGVNWDNATYQIGSSDPQPLTVEIDEMFGSALMVVPLTGYQDGMDIIIATSADGLSPSAVITLLPLNNGGESGGGEAGSTGDFEISQVTFVSDMDGNPLLSVAVDVTNGQEYRLIREGTLGSVVSMGPPFDGPSGPNSVMFSVPDNTEIPFTVVIIMDAETTLTADYTYAAGNGGGSDVTDDPFLDSEGIIKYVQLWPNSVGGDIYIAVEADGKTAATSRIDFNDGNGFITPDYDPFSEYEGNMETGHPVGGIALTTMVVEVTFTDSTVITTTYTYTGNEPIPSDGDGDGDGEGPPADFPIYSLQISEVGEGVYMAMATIDEANWGLDGVRMVMLNESSPPREVELLEGPDLDGIVRVGITTGNPDPVGVQIFYTVDGESLSSVRIGDFEYVEPLSGPKVENARYEVADGKVYLKFDFNGLEDAKYTEYNVNLPGEGLIPAPFTQGDGFDISFAVEVPHGDSNYFFLESTVPDTDVSINVSVSPLVFTVPSDAVSDGTHYGDSGIFAMSYSANADGTFQLNGRHSSSMPTDVTEVREYGKDEVLPITYSEDRHFSVKVPTAYIKALHFSSETDNFDRRRDGVYVFDVPEPITPEPVLAVKWEGSTTGVNFGYFTILRDLANELSSTKGEITTDRFPDSWRGLSNSAYRPNSVNPTLVGRVEALDFVTATVRQPLVKGGFQDFIIDRSKLGIYTNSSGVEHEGYSYLEPIDVVPSEVIFREASNGGEYSMAVITPETSLDAIDTTVDVYILDEGGIWRETAYNTYKDRGDGKIALDYDIGMIKGGTTIVRYFRPDGQLVMMTFGGDDTSMYTFTDSAGNPKAYTITEEVAQNVTFNEVLGSGSKANDVVEIRMLVETAETSTSGLKDNGGFEWLADVRDTDIIDKDGSMFESNGKVVVPFTVVTGDVSEVTITYVRGGNEMVNLTAVVPSTPVIRNAAGLLKGEVPTPTGQVLNAFDVNAGTGLWSIELPYERYTVVESENVYLQLDDGDLIRPSEGGYSASSGKTAVKHVGTGAGAYTNFTTVSVVYVRDDGGVEVIAHTVGTATDLSASGPARGTGEDLVYFKVMDEGDGDEQWEIGLPESSSSAIQGGTVYVSIDGGDPTETDDGVYSDGGTVATGHYVGTAQNSKTASTVQITYTTTDGKDVVINHTFGTIEGYDAGDGYKFPDGTDWVAPAQGEAPEFFHISSEGGGDEYWEIGLPELTNGDVLSSDMLLQLDRRTPVEPEDGFDDDYGKVYMMHFAYTGGTGTSADTKRVVITYKLADGTPRTLVQVLGTTERYTDDNGDETFSDGTPYTVS